MSALQTKQFPNKKVDQQKDKIKPKGANYSLHDDFKKNVVCSLGCFLSDSKD